MQTILGANGVVGRERSVHLPRYSNPIRQVSRSPKPMNATDELFSYRPLLNAIGTRQASDSMTSPVEGVNGGSISMLSVCVGEETK